MDPASNPYASPQADLTVATGPEAGIPGRMWLARSAGFFACAAALGIVVTSLGAVLAVFPLQGPSDAVRIVLGLTAVVTVLAGPLLVLISGILGLFAPGVRGWSIGMIAGVVGLAVSMVVPSMFLTAYLWPIHLQFGLLLSCGALAGCGAGWLRAVALRLDRPFLAGWALATLLPGALAILLLAGLNAAAWLTISGEWAPGPELVAARPILLCAALALLAGNCALLAGVALFVRSALMEAAAAEPPPVG